MLNTKNYFLLSIILMGAISCSHPVDIDELKTPYELGNRNQTATYDEGIKWWKDLENASPFVCVQTFGTTDAGLPLHLVVINSDRIFSVEKIRESGKRIWLINNAIHPGEPDGVDASMLFARDILSTDDFIDQFDSTVILIIPFYNVGGALNRNCCSRANQNGPESYGFRGNARNLDLNRDFIKSDSRNAQSFNELFTLWNPDIYLETHVSNGADYPYVMTYLSTHPDKLTEPLASFVKDELNPEMYKRMADRNDEMIPYVNIFNVPPDSGYEAFYDSPRYSTGYAALHHSIGVLTETHMLKPYSQRVESTRSFMHELADIICDKGRRIAQVREKSLQTCFNQRDFPLDWIIDSNKVSSLKFKGYLAYYDTSQVTGNKQLYYNRDIPWDKEINYWNHLKSSISVTAPVYYLVPAAWHEVIDRLKLNRAEMTLIEKDTTLEVSIYEISEMETQQHPYEGHYVHSKVNVSKRLDIRHILSNSYYIVDLNQKAKRYLIETLEPQGPDSYFSWNFYDEILQQKEWFSGYVFDQEATKMLEEPELKSLFDELKATDSLFAKSTMQQLAFLYKHSEHYERDRHMIYPVYRID